MKRDKPGLTIYAFGMITVMAAVISATTTVFIATKHGEMSARINELQGKNNPDQPCTQDVQLIPSPPPEETNEGDLQIYVGAFQPRDSQGAMLQFWIPTADFTVSSDAFTPEEKAACVENYGESVNRLKTEILNYSEGWNVVDIDGCWAPSGCNEGPCAVCEPGKIFTVILETKKKMEDLGKQLAAPQGQGLIHKLFCQDATLLIMNHRKVK